MFYNKYICFLNLFNADVMEIQLSLLKCSSMHGSQNVLVVVHKHSVKHNIYNII